MTPVPNSGLLWLPWTQRAVMWLSVFWMDYCMQLEALMEVLCSILLRCMTQWLIGGKRSAAWTVIDGMLLWGFWLAKMQTDPLHQVRVLSYLSRVLPNNLSSDVSYEQLTLLHTVWCYSSGEAAGEIWWVKRLTLSLPSFKSTYLSQPCKEQRISEVVRIEYSIIIFHLSKLWKARFSILCDVILLVRHQGKFNIDHSWEWKG